jgi:hypothetical protein
LFPYCWTRKLYTAYTIPGLSGHDSVSTYSRPRSGPIATRPVCCIISNQYLYMQQ